MFRVLSDEETKHVVRWKAPEFNSSLVNVVSTPQLAKPDSKLKGKTVTPLLGSSALKRFTSSNSSATLKLDLVAPTNVTTLDASTLRNAAPSELPLATASADMLQASYDEGYSKGLADLMAAMKNKKIQELSEIVHSMGTSSKETEDAELEKEVIGLSMDIAKWVVGQELTTQPRVIEQLVKRGLQQLHASKTDVGCIYLNPADVECVQQHITMPEEYLLLEDPTLERGNCRIESGSSTLRVGVDDWLDSVAKELGLTGNAADTSSTTITSPASGIEITQG